MFPEPWMLAFCGFTWWRKVRKPGETTLNGPLLSCYLPVLGIEHHFSVEDYANRKCLPWYLNPFHNGGLELWKKNLLPWKDRPFYVRKTSSETDYTMAVYPLSIKFIDLEYHVAKISWTLACEHRNRNTNTQKKESNKKVLWCLVYFNLQNSHKFFHQKAFLSEFQDYPISFIVPQEIILYQFKCQNRL